MQNIARYSYPECPHSAASFRQLAEAESKTRITHDASRIPHLQITHLSRKCRVPCCYWHGQRSGGNVLVDSLLAVGGCAVMIAMCDYGVLNLVSTCCRMERTLVLFGSKNASAQAVASTGAQPTAATAGRVGAVDGRCMMVNGELRLIGAAGADERHSKGQEHRDGRLHGRERGRRECQCFLSGDDDVFYFFNNIFYVKKNCANSREIGWRHNHEPPHFFTGG